MKNGKFIVPEDILSQLTDDVLTSEEMQQMRDELIYEHNRQEVIKAQRLEFEQKCQPDALLVQINELTERVDDLEELVNEQMKTIDYQSVAIRRLGI